MNTIEAFFDRIFIMNLARRPDRWTDSVNELRESGISPSNVERFGAYDHPENGHQGCTRSHRVLIRNIADGPWGRVLVLEDDFQVITLEVLKSSGFRPGSKVWETFSSILAGGGNLNDRFEAMAPYLPREWDVLYLGAGYGEPPISRLNEHVIRCGFMQTTSSYGITKEFAKTWTEKVDASVGGPNLERHPGPIDNVFGSMSKDHLYYVFQPRLLCQRKSKSDLDGETNSRINSMTDPVHESMV